MVAAGVALVTLGGPTRADEALMALGRHLSQECTTCHRMDGADNGIPTLVGLEADYFVETIGLYRNGRRDNQAMVSVAMSLDDEQIKALSLYFGSLPRPDMATGKASAITSPRRQQKR